MSSQKNGDARRAARSGGLPAGAAPLLTAAGVPSDADGACHGPVSAAPPVARGVADTAPRTGGGTTALRLPATDHPRAARAGRDQPQAGLPAVPPGRAGGPATWAQTRG